MATRGVGGSSPANVSRHLKGVEFPANKQDLIQQAEQNHAESEVIETIRRMPDREFRTMADVMKGYGQQK